jgi:transposase InsO family protein
VADLVDRDFTAQRPGAKLVGDITFIPTWEGWLRGAHCSSCMPWRNRYESAHRRCLDNYKE